jgi:hypothetical protein
MSNEDNTDTSEFGFAAGDMINGYTLADLLETDPNDVWSTECGHVIKLSHSEKETKMFHRGWKHCVPCVETFRYVDDRSGTSYYCVVMPYLRDINCFIRDDDCCDFNDPTLAKRSSIMEHIYDIDQIAREVATCAIKRANERFSSGLIESLYAFMMSAHAEFVAAGYIYIDIKPDNILVSDCGTKFYLCDLESIFKIGEQCGEMYTRIYSPVNLAKMDTLPEIVADEKTVFFVMAMILVQIGQSLRPDHFWTEPEWTEDSTQYEINKACNAFQRDVAEYVKKLPQINPIGHICGQLFHGNTAAIAPTSECNWLKTKYLHDMLKLSEEN